MDSENRNVFHPRHYSKDGRKECWDEMIDIFGVDAVIIFDCLNAYRYHYRTGEKADNSYEQDIQKMKNYMEHAEKLSKTRRKNSGVTSWQEERGRLFALDIHRFAMMVLNREIAKSEG